MKGSRKAGTLAVTLLAAAALADLIFAHPSGKVADPLAGIVGARAARTVLNVAISYPNRILVDGRAGTVLVGELLGPSYGSLLILDARTGHLRRAAQYDGDGMLVDAPTGRVFLANNTSFTGYGADQLALQMLDGATGRIVATTPVGPRRDEGSIPINGELAEDQQTRRIFLAYQGVQARTPGASQVRMFDADTGRLLHTSILGSQGDITVAIAADPRDGAVFVAQLHSTGFDTYAGTVYMLDARAGIVRGSTRVDFDWSVQLAVDERAHRILLWDGPELLWLDGRTGHLVHREDTTGLTGSENFDTPLIDDQSGHAFVLSVGEPGYSVNWTDVPSNPGILLMLSTQTGDVLQKWYLDRSGENSADIDPRHHRLFVTTGDGIQVIDTQTGSTVTQIALGRGAHDLAVDQGGRYVYALTGTSTMSECGAHDLLVTLDAATGRPLQAVPVRCGLTMSLVPSTHRMFVFGENNTLTVLPMLR